MASKQVSRADRDYICDWYEQRLQQKINEVRQSVAADFTRDRLREIWHTNYADLIRIVDEYELAVAVAVRAEAKRNHLWEEVKNQFTEHGFGRPGYSSYIKDQLEKAEENFIENRLDNELPADLALKVKDWRKNIEGAKMRFIKATTSDDLRALIDAVCEEIGEQKPI